MEPNNIIKPARLLPINEEAAAGPSNTPPSKTIPLAEQVTALVTEALKREGKAILCSLINPPPISNESDQTINVASGEDLSDMDKIPDVVKSLREFSGKPGEFGSWKKSVDRILTIYEPLKGSAKYYGILNVIRNKIVGYADIALESYNTPLNWERIARCLTMHYADKRDLRTLEYQMTTLVQGRSSVPEFYQAVYQHLSLILNKLCCMDSSQEILNAMTQSYRSKALDTFIRGLNGDLPRLLSVKEPVDLPQALHLCMKVENMEYRSQYAHNANSNRKNLPPPAPPRRTTSHPQYIAPIPAPRTNFYPELANYPQKNQSYQQNYPQPQFTQRTYHPQTSPQNPQNPQNLRHLPPKPIPKPEPMEVDPSMNSRAVNYMNHPGQQIVQKRPTSNQAYVPRKQQRIFNLEQDSPVKEETENYEENITQEDTKYDQTLVDYTETLENPTLEYSEHIDDIYFLD